jgi:hypothetical protein
MSVIQRAKAESPFDLADNQAFGRLSDPSDRSGGPIMTNETEPKPGQFVYKAPSQEELKQHRRIIFEFYDDVVRAHRGDTERLCEYLRSDLPLSHDKRELIAELIYRRIQRKHVGRPRGGDPVPNPAREAEKQIASHVRSQKLRRFGEKRVPRAVLDELINQVYESGGFDGEGPLSIDNIRRDLKRGVKRRHK